MRKHRFPRVTHHGKPVAYWLPDRGWRLAAATTTWMVRLSELLGEPWDVDEREAVRQAEAVVQANPWNAANLTVIHSEDSRGERPAHTGGSKMQTVKMYTDGACSGNPGPAGWVAILQCGSRQKRVVGGAIESTNNRAELRAVIAGLQALKRPCRVKVYTDSQYVIGMLSLGWKRKANHDLLAQADALLAQHEVSFVKIKAHNGHEMNERCDQAARAEVERQRSKADSGGTMCVGCGGLAREGNFCRDCREVLTPEEMDAAWAQYCQEVK